MHAIRPFGGLGRPPLTKLLPASGAWNTDMPAFHRQFFSLRAVPFALEQGGVLDEVIIAYETWGTLDPDGSNAVLLCHALTGDAHASGDSGPGQPSDGWWEPLIGPGRALDTDRYFVVCTNVLGGCQGTTGPASIDPDTGRPYGSSFPVVTVRDMVRAQRRLADELGIGRWLSVIGGSMGGMQVLEWGVIYPGRVRSLIAIASSGAASAQQIAWSAVGRQAISNDPKWRNGDYYDRPPVMARTPVWPWPERSPRSTTGPNRCSSSVSDGKPPTPSTGSACGIASTWSPTWTIRVTSSSVVSMRTATSC